MRFATFRIAARALARNRVRSALTMLGVVIGVASVIAMVAIGSGAKGMVEAQVASMGRPQLTVWPGATSSGGFNWGAGSNQNLTPNDAAAIARECPTASAVAIIVRTRGQNTVVYEDMNWSPASVQGCDPAFLTVREWPVVDGETFTDGDVAGAAQVCLVGQTIVDKVFRGESAVGRRIRLKGLPFRVVGVLSAKGMNTWGSDQDDVVLLPWTTSKKKLSGSSFNNVDQILVATDNAAQLPALEQDVRRTLRASHRLDRASGAESMDDFTIRNMTEMLQTMTATTGVMTTLLAAIASVSLLVGGIGIMNIMLVSVTERTREIGLRMAVGARGRDVLAQFLVEAVVLSGIGGLIGIGLGAGAASFVASQFKWPAAISADSIVLAAAFSGAVGVLFGFYPAWRASRLDPIEALRYE